jgi:hypothetical protein
MVQDSLIGRACLSGLDPAAHLRSVGQVQVGGGGPVILAEQYLDGAQVAASFERICGEACAGGYSFDLARLNIVVRSIVKLHLDRIDALDVSVACIDKEVDGNVEPFRAAIEMLSTIPGIGTLSAEVIVAEIGIDDTLMQG